MKLALYSTVLIISVIFEAHLGHAKVGDYPPKKRFPFSSLRHQQRKTDTAPNQNEMTKSELCKAANASFRPFYEAEKYGPTLTGVILTDAENYVDISAFWGPFGSGLYLQETDSENESNIDFRLNFLGSGGEDGDGCALHNVTIDIGDTGCSLALVNQVLQVSCPPDTLPFELRTLTLTPVPLMGFDNGATYMICGERGQEECTKQAYFINLNTGNFVTAKHIIPSVERDQDEDERFGK